MNDFKEPIFDTSDYEVIQPPAEAVVKQKAPEVSVMKVNERGAVVARDNAELMRVIKMMMNGCAFPKTLDTDAKVIAAWQVAAALKIPPAVAIQNMAIIQGSVCIWGQLPKALAEATGELEDFRLILINENQVAISLENKNLDSVPWGAVCQIKRKGRSTNEYVFTMNDAIKANLDKKSGPWRDYTKIMLQRRAVSHAIKFEFPDALMGVPVAEYDMNEAPDLKDVTPTGDAKESFKARIEEKLRGE